MALILWFALVACAALSWLLTWKDASRWLQWGFAIVFAVFAVWVVGTQLDVVTLWWPAVALALSLATSFWSDARQRRTLSDAGQPNR